jgi:hypothetical protein
MKQNIFLILLISCASLMAHAQEPAIQHRFLALDFWKGKVYHVDQANPSNNWEMPWDPAGKSRTSTIAPLPE